MATLPNSARIAALRNVTVLSLDNDVRIALIVKDVLHELGFQKIFVGHDGTEGLQIMRRQPIDLVISDWQMEPMGGIEFVKYLRGNPSSPNPYVPIILLTGKAEGNDVQFARDSGITEFVVKPFTVKRLVDRIVTVIENPRSFILTKAFRGPDRRRRVAMPNDGPDRRRKREQKK